MQRLKVVQHVQVLIVDVVIVGEGQMLQVLGTAEIHPVRLLPRRESARAPVQDELSAGQSTLNDLPAAQQAKQQQRLGLLFCL